MTDLILRAVASSIRQADATRRPMSLSPMVGSKPSAPIFPAEGAKSSMHVGFWSCPG